MGDVVSISAAAQQLALLSGEVTSLSGPREAFTGERISGLPFRDGDDVQIHYRACEGRPETIAVLFGPSTIEVVQALCRRLARSPERLIATAAPKFEQAWICDAEGRKPGARLALVKGIGWSLINVVLKKPDFARPVKLSAEPPARMAPPVDSPAAPWMADPTDERAWLNNGAYLPTPHGDPLSEDYE